jgi:hypothetical protein
VTLRSDLITPPYCQLWDSDDDRNAFRRRDSTTRKIGKQRIRTTAYRMLSASGTPNATTKIHASGLTFRTPSRVFTVRVLLLGARCQALVALPTSLRLML